jgi:hypothetical protein
MSRAAAESELWGFRTCSFRRARSLQVAIRRGWRTRFGGCTPFIWGSLAPRSPTPSLLGSGVLFFAHSAHQIIEQLPVSSYLLLTFDFKFGRHFGYGSRGQEGGDRREIRLEAQNTVRLETVLIHVTCHGSRECDESCKPPCQVLNKKRLSKGLSPLLPPYHLHPCPRHRSLIRPFP